MVWVSLGYLFIDNFSVSEFRLFIDSYGLIFLEESWGMIRDLGGVGLEYLECVFVC